MPPLRQNTSTDPGQRSTVTDSLLSPSWSDYLRLARSASQQENVPARNYNYIWLRDQARKGKPRFIEALQAHSTVVTVVPTPRNRVRRLAWSAAWSCANVATAPGHPAPAAHLLSHIPRSVPSRAFTHPSSPLSLLSSFRQSPGKGNKRHPKIA